MARGVFEYELTDDGSLSLSAHSVWKAREAFLAGDVTPLLELLAGMSQPHLSKLLTEILTGKIKRPDRRPKKIRMSRNDIVSIGILVRDLRRNGDPMSCNDRRHCPNPDPMKSSGWHGMKREAAIERAAEGLGIPKTRVKQAYTAFQRLEQEVKPLDEQPLTKRRSRRKPASLKM